MPNVRLGSRLSPIWKGICRVWHLIKREMRWVIGNGRNAKFWDDMWVGDETPLPFQII